MRSPSLEYTMSPGTSSSPTSRGPSRRAAPVPRSGRYWRVPPPPARPAAPGRRRSRVDHDHHAIATATARMPAIQREPGGRPEEQRQGMGELVGEVRQPSPLAPRSRGSARAAPVAAQPPALRARPGSCAARAAAARGAPRVRPPRTVGVPDPRRVPRGHDEPAGFGGSNVPPPSGRPSWSSMSVVRVSLRLMAQALRSARVALSRPSGNPSGRHPMKSRVRTFCLAGLLAVLAAVALPASSGAFVFWASNNSAI